MLDSSSTSLSALATALHHPCFWSSPLLGLVCFILASKRERVRYNTCGCVCGVCYSKITGGMCYQLMPGLPWDCKRPEVCYQVGSTFYQMVNKTQVRNIPFSNRVFLAHMCPIYRKTVAGSCNGNQRWVEVMNHEFRSFWSARETDLLFEDLLSPKIFT